MLAVLYHITKTSECCFLNGFMVLIIVFLKIAIDIISIKNTIIPSVTVPNGQSTASTGGATAKRNAAHIMKHFNVSIMTQVMYKALFIRDTMG